MIATPRNPIRLLIYGSRTWDPSVFEIEAVFAWFFARGPGGVDRAGAEEAGRVSDCQDKER